MIDMLHNAKDLTAVAMRSFYTLCIDENMKPLTLKNNFEDE